MAGHAWAMPGPCQLKNGAKSKFSARSIMIKDDTGLGPGASRALLMWFRRYPFATSVDLSTHPVSCGFSMTFMREQELVLCLFLVVSVSSSELVVSGQTTS